MDTRHPTDYVKMLYDRVQKYEPELVSKVIGYVLLHDNCHHEVIRLALGPDDEIHSIIDKAKYAIYRMQSSPVEHIHDIPHNLSSSQSHLIPWPPFMTSPWQPDHILDKFQLTTSRYRTVQKHPEIPSNKPCHYHSKGYCRHGVNCRYFHGQQVSPDSNEQPHQPHTSSPATMESLEIELTDLLKSIGGKPVSIAMLPGLYANKYGKVLEGDGYLTESRRQGKSGYNLTKFLARLNRSIQILDDRRHGQHLVVLAENAHRYMGRRNKKSDPGNIVVGSQQIYLTFPAWSNFTEYDVMKYFENFGPVEGVRIPLQQKRMYGFVTFASPETASVVLMKGNPHFICDSRVLVKPYREKIRDPKRINENANTTMMNHSSRYPRLMTKNVAQNDEEHNIFQLQMQLSTITLHEQEEEGSYRLWGYHGLHRNTSGEQARTHLINNYSSSNQESGAIQLPENPFSISCSSVSYS